MKILSVYGNAIVIGTYFVFGAEIPPSRGAWRFSSVFSFGGVRSYDRVHPIAGAAGCHFAANPETARS